MLNYNKNKKWTKKEIKVKTSASEFGHPSLILKCYILAKLCEIMILIEKVKKEEQFFSKIKVVSFFEN